MQTFIIVIHLLIVIALVGLILVQRSEGGGLGIGGGSGFMTARGSRNALTRLTAILAACFFATSLILGVLQSTGDSPSSILDQIDDSQSVLDQLGGSLPDQPAGDDGVPSTSAPLSQPQVPQTQPQTVPGG